MVDVVSELPLGRRRSPVSKPRRDYTTWLARRGLIDLDRLLVGYGNVDMDDMYVEWLRAFLGLFASTRLRLLGPAWEIDSASPSRCR